MTDKRSDDDHQDDKQNDDSVDTEPATPGHSDADSQAQRNTEDESPS